MEGYKLTIRLTAIALMVCALVILMGGRLTGLQFAETPPPVPPGERTVTRTVTIPAARGEILDRYGRTLVTNRLAYDITVDRARLFRDGKQAETALKLIKSAGGCGSAYTDTLPVTLPPFQYTEMTAEQKKYLSHYLIKKGWEEGLTAAELMDRLFDAYGMTAQKGDDGGAERLRGFSVYEARLAAGVLYETDLRYQAEIVERDEITNEVIKPYMYVPPYIFAADIPMEFIANVAENAYPGVDVVTSSARVYLTDAAAHILGRVGAIQGDTQKYLDLGYNLDEIVGVDGVEKAFENWLRGTAGQRLEETDLHGRVRNVIETHPPEAGHNTVLTIDIRLQEELERLLAEGVRDLIANGEPLRGAEAEAAACVILDINNGEVLAAANYPTYSLKTFSRDFAGLLDDPMKPLFNRAVSGTYAPGSTFKMVTAAAALESGIVTPNTKIFDQHTYTYYDAPQPTCTGWHGNVAVTDALKVSCNYYFFEFGRLTGISNIVKWANRFGLGLPTGCELEDSGRATLGRVAGPETSEALHIQWYGGNTLSAAIGQDNNMFTPMQLANYTASIANGGTLYKAHLLKEVLNYDYSYEYYVAQPEVFHELGLKPENLKAIQDGMRSVTKDGGTAYNVFRDFDITVAGKTGTAQVGDRPNNGVFVCYAPADDPVIALAIAVEKGGAGSTVSPIAREVLRMYFELQEDMKNNPAEGGLMK